MILFNCQEEMIPYLSDHPELPVVAELHEDGSGKGGTDFLKPWRDAKVNIWAYRGMSPYSDAWRQLPNGARFQFQNEHDDDLNVPRTVSYLTDIKQTRPDIILISPPSDTSNWPADGEWPEDATVKSMCYFYGLHIPYFATLAEIQARRSDWGVPPGTGPFAVLEVELDPSDQANYDPATYRARLMQGAQTALAAGAQVAALWGKDPQFSDAIRDDQLRAAVAAYNNAGKQPTPIGGPKMPDFVIGPGFAAKIAEKGWTAASDEVYFTQDANAKLSVVSCDEGLLFYDSSNNKVGVLPFV